MNSSRLPSAARLFAVALQIGFLRGLIGCARTEAIPVYPEMSESQALHVLSDRARAIHTVSSEALVTLTRKDGQTVRFDAALVMEPPERARMQAFKFGQTVLDLTITRAGVWLLTPDVQHEETFSVGMRTGEMTNEWMRLATGLFDDAKVSANNRGANLLVQEAQTDSTTITSRIDRKTLTIREVTGRDRNDRQQFELKFAGFLQLNSIVWPRRIEAISEAGRILIELRDVEINGQVPTGAFKPPPRAERLP